MAEYAVGTVAVVAAGGLVGQIVGGPIFAEWLWQLMWKFSLWVFRLFGFGG